jgi:transposase
MTLLDGFSGILQVSGYAAHKKLAETQPEDKTLVLVFCLAHARRKFFDVHASNGSPIAKEALHKIGALFARRR